MNQISELSRLPKGADVEFKGVVSYENPPRASMYGGGFNQFVVVKSGDFGIGVNIPVHSIDEGYIKGTSLIVKGKVDKYPDKKQPLTSEGTYPMRTSIKATVVEEYRDVEDFPEQETVVTKESIVNTESASVKGLVNKPSYSAAKNVEEEQKRIRFEKRDLLTAKESACKTVGKWIETGKIDLKDYFKWCTKLVDYFYNEDEGFDLMTEANLMHSGLVEVNKTQALAWIRNHMKGTELTLEGLNVPALDKQTLPELLETATRVATALSN